MEEKKRVMTRRDFIRGTIGVTIGASVFGTNWSAEAEEQVSVPRSSVVTLVRDEHVMDESLKVDKVILLAMLGQVLSSVTGQADIKDAWLSLVKPNDTIGLVTTQAGVSTHPELVEIVTDTLVAAGIPKDKIIMAQSRSTEPVKSCTALINMPGLKTHLLTGIGTVLKNYIMFSGNARAYHLANSIKLGEIWNLPYVKGKTKLNLVDALYPLCDKGPQVDPNYRWAYNGLMAGIDPVAVDTVGLQIIQKKRNEMKGEPWPIAPPPLCVEAADKEFGLGTSKIEEIQMAFFGWEKDRLI